jgi:hypothetical protein
LLPPRVRKETPADQERAVPAAEALGVVDLEATEAAQAVVVVRPAMALDGARAAARATVAGAARVKVVEPSELVPAMSSADQAAEARAEKANAVAAAPDPELAAQQLLVNPQMLQEMTAQLATILLRDEIRKSPAMELRITRPNRRNSCGILLQAARLPEVGIPFLSKVR